MAVLARLVGIPSRIEIGYTSGIKQHGRWQVTTADAHSWPELFFTGLGWLQFEPTPGGHDGQGTARQPNYATHLAPSIGIDGGRPTWASDDGPGQNRREQPSQRPHDRSRSRWRPRQVPDRERQDSLADRPAAAQPARPADPGRGGPAWPASSPGHGAGAPRPTTAPWPAPPGGSTPASMTSGCPESSASHHEPWPGASPPRARSTSPPARRCAASPTVVEHIRYAPTPAPTTAISLRADVTEVRRSLRRAPTAMHRVKARLFPASTIAPMAARLGQSVGQLTGWVVTTPAET